jgi:hypothetical protein
MILLENKELPTIEQEGQNELSEWGGRRLPENVRDKNFQIRQVIRSGGGEPVRSISLYICLIDSVAQNRAATPYYNISEELLPVL